MSDEADQLKHRLTSKRSGKLSSSSTWLLDLAASTVVENLSGGVISLLPQEQAAKLLVHNELKPFKQHARGQKDPGDESSPKELRLLAEAAATYLKVFYITQVCADKDPSRVNLKGFRSWLMESLEQPGSPLNKDLGKHPKYSALQELIRKDNWWRKVLKTASKKSPK